MAALISYVPLYRSAEFSSILLLRRQHINPVRYSDLLTHPQSSSRKPRLQVCVLRPSATASSARGNRWGSVLGMGKARPVCRALVGGVRFSVSGWTKCPEVGACSAICCFLLSSHLKSVQNCLDKYKRSQNIHKNLDAHQYYN